jgi:PAS domain S-box-containing protein
MSSSPFWSRFLFNPWCAVSAILGVGLAGSYAIFGAFDSSQDGRLQQLAAQQAAAESSLLRSRLDLLISRLDPLSIELGQQRLAEPAAVQALASSLLQRESSLSAVQWVPLVRPAEKALFEQQAGRFGAGTSPRVRLDANPGNSDGPFWLFYYTEPHAFAEAGRNEASKVELLRSLEHARTSLELSLTSAQPPSASNGSATTVQVVKPIPALFTTPDGSFKAGDFTGALIASVRMESLIQGGRGLGAGSPTDLLLLDVTPGVPEQNQLLFSSLSPGSDLGALQGQMRRGWYDEERFSLGGHTWLALYRINPQWLAAHRTLFPLAFAAFGVLLTLAAAFQAWKALRRNARNEKLLDQTCAELGALRQQAEEDLQGRAELEAQLRSSQHQLNALMENSPSAIFMKDAQGRYLTVNRQFAEMHNRTREHFVGRSDLDIFPPEVAARLRLSDTRVLSSGKPIELEDSLALSNGTHTSIVHKFPLIDQSGEIRGLCGIATDISERKRAEADVRESRRQLESLLGQLPGMAFRFVNDGQFTPVYVSRGALGLTGHSARDFIEGVIKLEDVIHPEDRERARSAIANAVKKRRSFEVDYRLIDRSGHTKWVLERGQGVYDEEGRLLSIEGLAIDITQRKDAEAEKLLVERRLLEGQKLESIGVLAGGIAHDFNNLLTGIIGNANLASLEIPETSRVQQNLKQIEFASQRAAELCQQMLAYAGKGRFVVQRVEFGSLVENTVPLLRASISKRAQLLFELTSDLPPVIADPTQMRQIVMNLVLNASEALGEHDGQIIISTDLRRPTSEYFAGAVLTPPDLNHDFVVLQVRDTGSGMGQETLAKIFDPFFTTKFAGRGLGLAAVLGIIRSHRGGLKVVSTPGAGSTFTLLFPVTPGPAEPGAPRRNTAVPWRQEGLALIIDDEDHVRHVTAGMLQTCGMKTELARDGYEGLDLFRSKPNDFDLVVLDMTMPRLSGEETLQLLREVNPDVRVLFISGYNRREVVDTLGGNGALSFIQKPFTLEILRDQLRNMLA